MGIEFEAAIAANPDNEAAHDNLKDLQNILSKEGVKITPKVVFKVDENDPFFDFSNEGEPAWGDDFVDWIDQDEDSDDTTNIVNLGVKSSPELESIMNRKLRDRREFYRFIGSNYFKYKHWEKVPVKISFQDGVEPFRGALTWAELLSGQYNNGDDVESSNGEANVNFLKKNLYDDDEFRYKATGRRRGTVTGPQLISGIKNGFTLNFNGASYWLPKVAEINLNITRMFGLPSRTNVYVTGEGLADTMNPHTDFQCTFIVQLEGAKRWKLWKKKDNVLPVRHHMIVGKNRQSENDNTPESLGKPLVDVVLRPGDILYIPRGYLHATATNVDKRSDYHSAGSIFGGEAPSMHLTVGVESLWDLGVSNTWESFLGGKHASTPSTISTVTTGWSKALLKLTASDVRFRRAVPKSLLTDFEGDEWKSRARSLMHSVVDAMLDETSWAYDTYSRLRTDIDKHNDRLYKLVIENPDRWEDDLLGDETIETLLEDLMEDEAEEDAEDEDEADDDDEDDEDDEEADDDDEDDEDDEDDDDGLDDLDDLDDLGGDDFDDIDDVDEEEEDDDDW